MNFRPVAVPLVTVDPFFSIYSTSDALYGAPTQHWSGKECPIFAGVYINGAYYSMCGFNLDGKFVRSRIYQRSLDITPTSSVYVFENKLAKVKLTFRTPLLLTRLDIMTRPVSYVEYEIENKCDGKIQFVFGISSRACVNYGNQEVSFKKTDYSVCCGNTVQNPLSSPGDNVMIDWGYLHLCDRSALVGRFTYGDKFETMSPAASYNAFTDSPYLFVMKDALSGVVTLAYDEIKPIEYFGSPRDEYYKEHFSDFGEMVNAAKREYPEIKEASEKFDSELMNEAAALGENYKRIISLAYRQAVAAHKLVLDEDGNILFLSKENDSNGCIGTLDVTYPSIPLFLKYAPELVKGMLRPIIKYAKSSAWKYPFAPHDVGTYPLANGQVYGAELKWFFGTSDFFAGTELRERMQMPVEESGNMLIALAAVKKYSGGDTELFDENRELMKSWCDYLVKFGYDPGNQLCTDDFAGHLARNCNLSLKAIIGIAAYADLSGDESYMEIARKYAKNWEKDALASHGATKLTFDGDDSWSLKYNVVWDKLLGYGLFSDEMKVRETEHYKKMINRYGTPMDSRSSVTKIDWLMWSTAVSDSKEYFDSVCESIIRMMNETLDRVPLTDYYCTEGADFLGMKCRSVVGGLFINLI